MIRRQRRETTQTCSQSAVLALLITRFPDEDGGDQDEEGHDEDGEGHDIEDGDGGDKDKDDDLLASASLGMIRSGSMSVVLIRIIIIPHICHFLYDTAFLAPLGALVGLDF